MKFKGIDDFTIEDCREFLKQRPNGPQTSEVIDRMFVLQDMAVEKKLQEQKETEVQRKKEEKIKWLDIKEFRETYPFKTGLSSFKKSIYNIEDCESDVRRVQNERGFWGLCLLLNGGIVRLLAFDFNWIGLCGEDAYVCVRGITGGKVYKGVYNTQKREMVIPVEYDEIEPLQNDFLKVVKDGVVSKYTTKGFRVME